MHNEEYEKAYNDAREALHRRGKKVGGPGCSSGGIRYCPVDGFLLTDRDLLIEAWGESLAAEIITELAESDSRCCCPEGSRLWRQYSDGAKRYVKLLIQQQIAESNQDSATLAQLVPTLQPAAEFRRLTRQALLDHAATHAHLAA
jgi:hypothetical protein